MYALLARQHTAGRASLTPYLAQGGKSGYTFTATQWEQARLMEQYVVAQGSTPLSSSERDKGFCVTEDNVVAHHSGWRCTGSRHLPGLPGYIDRE